MSTTTTKDGHLNIRCDSRARQLLDKAAAYAQTSVSDFVLSHALAAADEIVQANEAMNLTAMDLIAFLAALDGPVEPHAALARAFDRHGEQVRQ